MTRRDAFCAAVFLVLLTLWMGPALFFPSRGFANFGDLYAYHYPLRYLVASSLEAGHLPFWNPYVLSGVPLAANSQAVLFYPAAVAGRIFPLGLSFSWEAWFHLFWGAWGWALWSRAEGLRAAESWVMGAWYALLPLLVYRVTEGIPTLLGALAWAA